MNRSNRYAINRESKYLIACDLDGTLLNSNHEISKHTINKVKAITKAGHIFCILTGRPLSNAINFYKALGLKTIIVNQNGSCFYNPTDPEYRSFSIGFNKSIVLRIFNNKIITKIIEDALIEGIDIGWILNNRNDKRDSMKSLLSIFHISSRQISDLNGDLSKVNTDITAIILIVKSLENYNEIIYELKTIAPTLVIRNFKLLSGQIVIEINTNYASKGNALVYLSSYYGIAMDSTIAFGDEANDIKMLSIATWGFAMKNGSDAAKLSSRYITKRSNEEDGVVRDLIKFLNVNADN